MEGHRIAKPQGGALNFVTRRIMDRRRKAFDDDGCTSRTLRRILGVQKGTADEVDVTPAQSLRCRAAVASETIKFVCHAVGTCGGELEVVPPQDHRHFGLRCRRRVAVGRHLTLQSLVT